MIFLDCLVRDHDLSRQQVNCYRTQLHRKSKGYNLTIRLKWSKDSCIKQPHSEQGDLVEIRVTNINTHKYTVTAWRFPPGYKPIPNTVTSSFDTSPPARVHRDLMTSSQGEESNTHGIRATHPFVGRLVASGELGSSHIMSERHSTTLLPPPTACIQRWLDVYCGLHNGWHISMDRSSYYTTYIRNIHEYKL